MTEFDTREEKEGLEEKFVSLFSGKPPNDTERRDLEDRLLWSYLIENLNEKEAPSSDPGSLIVADYCLDFGVSDAETLYDRMNGGEETLLKHCVEKLSSIDTSCVKGDIPRSEEKDDTGKDDLGLSMLYTAYCCLLNNSEIVNMIDEAGDIKDLKGLVFLDRMSATTGAINDLLNDDAPIHDKVMRGARAGMEYFRTKKRKERMDSIRNDTENIQSQQDAYTLEQLKEALQKIDCYINEASECRREELSEQKEALLNTLSDVRNGIDSEIENYWRGMKENMESLRKKADQIFQEMENSPPGLASIVFRTSRYVSFRKNLRDLGNVSSELQELENEKRRNQDNSSLSAQSYAGHIEKINTKTAAYRERLESEIARVERFKDNFKSTSWLLAKTGGVFVLSSMLLYGGVKGVGYLNSALERNKSESRSISGGGRNQASTKEGDDPSLGAFPYKNHPKVWVYAVRKGDTLSDISKEVSGTSQNYPDIAEHNGIDNPNLIYVNQYLVIPDELAKNREELHRIWFVEDPKSSSDKVYSRDYYPAEKGERIEDIAKAVTGSAGHAGIVLKYNRRLNPSFSEIMDRDTHVHFPPELVKNRQEMEEY